MSRFRQLRKATGLDLDSFAAVAGLAPARARVLDGGVPPTDAEVVTLSKAFGADEAFLRRGENERSVLVRVEAYREGLIGQVWKHVADTARHLREIRGGGPQ